MLDAWQERELRDLAWHWSEAYEISVVDDTWTAVPLVEPATVLTADSAQELRELVRIDYADRAEAKRAASRLA
jgi:hypothetical protein